MSACSGPASHGNEYEWWISKQMEGAEEKTNKRCVYCGSPANHDKVNCSQCGAPLRRG
jgi:predicted amidophosphoribosyltransferase